MYIVADIVLIVIYCVAACIAILALNYFPLPIVIIILGGVNFSLIFVKDWYRARLLRYEVKRKAKKLTNKVFKIVKNISDIEYDEKNIIKDILNTTMDFVPINIIDWVVHEIQPKDQITADVFYVVMCWQLVKDAGLYEDTKKQLRDKLDEKISERADNSSENIDFQTKIKAALYNIESGLAFDKDCDISQLDDSVWKQFLKKYSQLGHVILILNLDKERASEAHTILRKLVNQGKIRSDSVVQSLAGTDHVKGSIDAFILYTNNIQRNDKFESTISLMHHVDAKSYSINKANYARKVLFLPAGKWTSQDIIDKLIKPCFAEGEVIKVCVGVKNINDVKLARFPTEIQEGWSEHLKNGWNNLNAIASDSEITTKSESNKDKTTAAEILSILPLNIFIPDAPQNVRDFIEDNFNKLKQKHNIREFHDWASVNEDELRNTLIALDEAQKKKSGKKRMAIDKKWEEYVGTIIKQVKEYQSALT